MVEEIMEEIKSRQGSSALPDGQELRKRVEDALKSRTKDEKAQ
jgi:hypothetical protein